MVKIGDIKNLSSKILTLLYDEEQRRKKAEEIYKHVQKYTWDNAVNNELLELTALVRKR